MNSKKYRKDMIRKAMVCLSKTTNAASESTNTDAEKSEWESDKAKFSLKMQDKVIHRENTI